MPIVIPFIPRLLKRESKRFALHRHTGFACTCGRYIFRFECGHPKEWRHVCGNTTGESGRDSFCYHPANIYHVNHIVLEGACRDCMRRTW